jgi:O-acetyl-ADP-ribose deacetylase (regulator of RNase III)
MSDLKAEYMAESGQMLQARQGDLTQEDTDAIVNAANSHLAHGGGAAGAIVRRGGWRNQAESEAGVGGHGQVPTGQVAVTGAGRLACRHVIHAVGPVWHGGGRDEAELLRSAVWNSLVKAHEMELASIAMPAISSGIFGFPKDRCAHILVRTALDFCEDYPDSPLREIRFTNIDKTTVDLFVGELDKLAA